MKNLVTNILCIYSHEQHIAARALNSHPRDIFTGEQYKIHVAHCIESAQSLISSPEKIEYVLTELKLPQNSTPHSPLLDLGYDILKTLHPDRIKGFGLLVPNEMSTVSFPEPEEHIRIVISNTFWTLCGLPEWKKLFDAIRTKQELNPFTDHPVEDLLPAHP